MKFYVASSFRNVDIVRYVANQLINKGFIQTLDWTRYEAEISTIEQLKEIAQCEKNAVYEADFIIVILPAGKGSHIELGMAIGQAKKIYLYSPKDEVHDLATTSSFYHLDEVDTFTGTVEELIEYVCTRSTR
ncbi:group-specific protein [Paenibacillus sp. RC67]|uniref:group-specific protein n=1 Tax=Paenibacillus sp. RC67 TaxID=3039392 RepID=UPI0024AE44BC|nr:group-specific protein [Paenibacillus sp. RC67]